MPQKVSWLSYWEEKFFCVREVFSLEVTLTPIMCLLVVLVFMSIGDIVSMKTKAFVPSVFVAAVLFLAGYWGGWLPKDIVDRAQMGAPIATISMYLLITHMGTMMSVRELCREWKTVVIAVAGLAGMALLLWYVGPLFTTLQLFLINYHFSQAFSTGNTKGFYVSFLILSFF